MGLNQGPPDYESDALTNWAIGPFAVSFQKIVCSISQICSISQKSILYGVRLFGYGGAKVIGFCQFSNFLGWFFALNFMIAVRVE